MPITDKQRDILNNQCPGNSGKGLVNLGTIIQELQVAEAGDVSSVNGETGVVVLTFDKIYNAETGIRNVNIDDGNLRFVLAADEDLVEVQRSAGVSLQFGINASFGEMAIAGDGQFVIMDTATESAIWFESGGRILVNPQGDYLVTVPAANSVKIGGAANQLVGVHGAAVIQAVHIADASGGSGNLDTIVNAILVALENKGILASA